MEKTPPIQQKYVFLAAVILTILMIFQSNVMVDGQWRLHVNKVIVFGFNYLTWAISVPFIYRTTSAWKLQTQWKTSLLKWLLIVLAICLGQLLVSNLLYYATILGFFDADISDPFGHFMAFFPQAYMSRLIDFAVIFAILRGLDNNRKLSAQQVAVAQLESQLTQSRLEALKMQLNPHFLFNSLHAIHSLIGYEDDKAKAMVLKISSLLRKILELGAEKTIIVSDELSYLKDYLDIEQERFHDRLNVSYHIQDDLLNAHVPSLILQPLAENALKHGISQLEGPGEIVLAVEKSADQGIMIRMTNTVPHETTESKLSTGIGLTNLKNRLEQTYPGAFQLTVTRHSNRFQVEITLPLRHD